MTAQRPTKEQLGQILDSYREIVWHLIDGSPLYKWNNFDRDCVGALLAEINALHGEIARLKEGKFTDEELQALCHNLTTNDLSKFQAGCRDYQAKLFGPEKVREAELLRLRSEAGDRRDWGRADEIDAKLNGGKANDHE
jgi:hypothetical protein